MLVRSVAILACLTCVVIGCRVRPERGVRTVAQAHGSEVVPLCSVLRSAEEYRDKWVSVRGTYRVGYEASELYCLSCSTGGHVWVEFDSVEGGRDAARAVNGLTHKGLGTVNGVFSGTFHANGSYGHLGAYRYELSVGSASDLKLVDRLGLPPSRLPAGSRARVCQ